MEITGQLTGGNLSQVRRVGNTVRRDTGPWTNNVHRLLAHLRSKGIQEVPAPLGYDQQGREILSFIPGIVGHQPTPQFRSDRILISAAKLLRKIHDASEDFARQITAAGWQSPAREPVEVICHGDFAPYNCVFENGELIGVIDFDNAHPGERNWDVSYAAYRFVPLTDPSNPENYGDIFEQCRRLQVFCEAYGVQDASKLVELIIQRVAFMADYLIRGAEKGDIRLQTNIAVGHLAVYQTDLIYIQTHAEQLKIAVH